MSHHKLREDKKCQNCGSLVRKRFCPKCGQENTETRQPFHYLFTHFVEDLLHYDGSFWKTLKTLSFKPGVLTVEYLKGRRKQFVAPVKLYIFVSFFVFFVGGMIAKVEDTYLVESQEIPTEITPTSAMDAAVIQDSIVFVPDLKTDEKPARSNSTKILDEYFEIQNSLPEDQQDGYFKRKVLFEVVEIIQNSEEDPEYADNIADIFAKNLPTFIFCYMPVFAFFMWLFHNKKKWYFFDHGIFTLHYFSFLLLNFFLIISVLGVIDDFPFLQHDYIAYIFYVLYTISFLWMPIYFYKAHKKLFGFSRRRTLFQTAFLFIFNAILLTLGIAIYIATILYSL